MPFPQQIVQFVRPVAAPQHADQRPGWTGGHMLGESVAEFFDDHCSGTVGCISRDVISRVPRPDARARACGRICGSMVRLAGL